MSTIAEEWVAVRRAMIAVGYPADLLDSVVEPIFYGGALAALTLLARGAGVAGLQGELAYYAFEHLDWPLSGGTDQHSGQGEGP